MKNNNNKKVFLVSNPSKMDRTISDEYPTSSKKNTVINPTNIDDLGYQ